MSNSMKKHNYNLKIQWTGNEDNGTANYKAYNRNHTISVNGKYDVINGSSDPAFLGDKSRYNPEELFLSSISACHMLWYLHLCSIHDVIVIEYLDNATGIMQEDEDEGGKFIEVILHPEVKVAEIEMIDKANKLHAEANKKCFIANSCNFKIEHVSRTKCK